MKKRRTLFVVSNVPAVMPSISLRVLTCFLMSITSDQKNILSSKHMHTAKHCQAISS
jgi:hypothetical protein